MTSATTAAKVPPGTTRLTMDSPRARVPLHAENLSLMPHQEAMLHKSLVVETTADAAARRLKEHDPAAPRPATYAVMCDHPGAGKTFVVLALVLQEVRRKRMIMRRMGIPPQAPAAKGNDQTLVVVPFNIYTQWEDAIRLCCGDEVRFKAFVDYADISGLFFQPEAIKEYDVLLTTDLYFAAIAHTLNTMNVRVRRTVFDEIDSIASLVNVPITCDHVWFVSASFDADKLGSSFKQQHARSLGGNTVLCEDEFVRDSITLPKPREHTLVCQNAIIDGVLAGVLSREEMHAINAMDLDAVSRSMLLRCVDDERELVICLRDVAREQLAAAEKEAASLAKRKDYSPLTDKEQARDEKAHDTIQRTTHLLDVLHTRAEEHAICPEDFVPRDPNALGKKHAYILSLVDEIRQREGDGMRVILFSDHPSFKHVIPGLHARALAYAELDGGNIRAMDRILTQYRSGETPVLIVDSSMYGCGMNLENTTDIIFAHAVNTSKRCQIIGRAQRYGRMGPLYVWTLLYGNER